MLFTLHYKMLLTLSKLSEVENRIQWWTNKLSLRPQERKCNIISLFLLIACYKNIK